jgi:mono/diheme cytochrome c family protein
MPIRSLFPVLVAALALCASLSVAYSHGMNHNPTRHGYLMKNRIPAQYRKAVNTLAMTEENLAAGARLYEENCASCHGEKGKGDGEAAKDLKPSPTDLTGMYDRPMMRMGRRGHGGHREHGRMHHHPGMSHAQAMGGLSLDAYYFWAVSDGGAQMGSAMPAFKEILSEQERWQILLYLANGFSKKAGG